MRQHAAVASGPAALYRRMLSHGGSEALSHASMAYRQGIRDDLAGPAGRGSAPRLGIRPRLVLYPKLASLGEGGKNPLVFPKVELLTGMKSHCARPEGNRPSPLRADRPDHAPALPKQIDVVKDIAVPTKKMERPNGYVLVPRILKHEQ